MRLLPQVEDGTSPVTEAITAAVRDSGGRALGGKAVFIPLLERCRTDILVQVRKLISYPARCLLTLFLKNGPSGGLHRRHTWATFVALD